MLLEKIELKPNKILVQPTPEASSSFSTERKRYDRKSVGVIKGIGLGVSPSETNIGDKIIYNDTNSIDFELEGDGYSIIGPEDIVAYIKEDK